MTDPFFDYAMDDLCDCLAEIDRLNATIQRVRDVVDSNVRPLISPEDIRRALEGGDS